MRKQKGWEISLRSRVSTRKHRDTTDYYLVFSSTPSWLSFWFLSLIDRSNSPRRSPTLRPFFFVCVCVLPTPDVRLPWLQFSLLNPTLSRLLSKVFLIFHDSSVFVYIGLFPYHWSSSPGSLYSQIKYGSPFDDSDRLDVGLYPP